MVYDNDTVHTAVIYIHVTMNRNTHAIHCHLFLFGVPLHGDIEGKEGGVVLSVQWLWREADRTTYHNRAITSGMLHIVGEREL